MATRRMVHVGLVFLCVLCHLKDVSCQDVCGIANLELRTDTRKMCVGPTQPYSRKPGSRVEYTCSTFIKDFKAMINYCPVEVCQLDGTWTQPSLSCAETECYYKRKSKDYMGKRICTKTGRACQRWDQQEPHKHRFKDPTMFPEYADSSLQTYAIFAAQAYCRDPGGTRGQPWCYTTDPIVKWEYCHVPECSEYIVNDGSCVSNPSDGNSKEEPHVVVPTDLPVTSTTKEKLATTTPTVATTTDTMYCERGHTVQFKVQKGLRLSMAGFIQKKVRSRLECAALCSTYTSCQLYAFSNKSRKCFLYRRLGNLTPVTGKKYHFGTRVC